MKSILKHLNLMAVGFALGLSFAVKVLELGHSRAYLSLKDPVIATFTKGNIYQLTCIQELALIAIISSPATARIRGAFCMWTALCCVVYHVLRLLNAENCECSVFGHFMSELGVPDLLASFIKIGRAHV